MVEAISRRMVLGAGTMLTAQMLSKRAIASTPKGPIKTGTVRAGDVRLFYRDTGGRGEPVIFLHPNTGDASSFVNQQAAFAKEGFRTISYSRRGFKGSDTGPMDKLGTGSGDLDALAKSLKLGRFHAVAVAAGAFVAADYAITNAQGLLSLTLASSIVGFTSPEDAALQARLRPDGFGKMPASFRELGPSYRAENPEGTALWEKTESEARHKDMKRQSFASTLTKGELGTVKVPTLLIACDADLYAPPPLARKLATVIPGSKLAIIPETGHAPHWEKPDQFNRIVLDFLHSL